DFDVVDDSNLQRQILYGTADVGRPKLAAAAARLRDLNPNVEVVTLEERLTSENALAVVRDFDVVADGTDNFPTRYLVNDACVLTGKPNVYASIFRFEGQASVFWAEKGPCYRCLYAEPPPPGLVPSCAEGGVLGILPGLLGTIQATETIKLLLGSGEPLIGRLLLVDALSMRFRELKLRKNPNCVICGPRPTVTRLIDYEAFCGVGAESSGAAVVSSAPMAANEVSVEELKGMRDRGESFVLVHVPDPSPSASRGSGPSRTCRTRSRSRSAPSRRASTSSRRRTRSSSTAGPARAAETRCSSCRGWVSRRPRTWSVESTSGRSGSTRLSRSTERSRRCAGSESFSWSSDSSGSWWPPASAAATTRWRGRSSPRSPRTSAPRRTPGRRAAGSSPASR